MQVITAFSALKCIKIVFDKNTSLLSITLKNTMTSISHQHSKMQVKFVFVHSHAKSYTVYSSISFVQLHFVVTYNLKILCLPDVP